MVLVGGICLAIGAVMLAYTTEKPVPWLTVAELALLVAPAR